MNQQKYFRFIAYMMLVSYLLTSCNDKLSIENPANMETTQLGTSNPLAVQPVIPVSVPTKPNYQELLELIFRDHFMEYSKDGFMENEEGLYHAGVAAGVIEERIVSEETKIRPLGDSDTMGGSDKKRKSSVDSQPMLKRSKQEEAKIAVATQLGDFSRLPEDVLLEIMDWAGYKGRGHMRELNRAFYYCMTGFPQPAKGNLQQKPELSFFRPTWVLGSKVAFTHKKFIKLVPTISSFVFNQLLGSVKDLPADLWPYVKESNIQEIDLSGKKIATNSLAKLLGCLQGSKVKKLNLAHCSLENKGVEMLMKGLGTTEIEDLNLSHNLLERNARRSLGKNGWQALKVYLKNPRNKLKKLWLSSDGLDKENMRWVKCLKDSGIECLDLSNNHIGNERAKILATALEGSNIQELNVSNSDISAEGATGLANALRGSPIQKLDLSNNPIGDAGVMVLALALQGTLVKELYLRSCQISDLGVAALAGLLQNSSIQKLDLSDNPISDTGVMMLAAALQGSHIQGLYLRSSQIGDVGIMTLVEALKGNEDIQKLYLRSCQISDLGVAALVELLYNSCIQELDLSDNPISIEGVKALAVALQDSKIQQLDLSFNQIGDVGASVLVEALKGNKHIRKLHLSGNQISDAGVVSLVELLYNSCIQELDLSFNRIGVPGATALAKVLQENKNIQKLYLYNNQIGKARAQELKDAFEGEQLSL